jgi:hypothetical protein
MDEFREKQQAEAALKEIDFLKYLFRISLNLIKIGLTCPNWSKLVLSIFINLVNFVVYVQICLF